MGKSPGNLYLGRMWPPQHTVDTTQPAVPVTFPDQFWWNAPKSSMGETTDANRPWMAGIRGVDTD